MVESVLDGPLTFTPVTTPDGSPRYMISGKTLGARALFITESDPNWIRTRGVGFSVRWGRCGRETDCNAAISWQGRGAMLGVTAE